MARAPDDPNRAAVEQRGVVVVTGAGGFIGRAVCSEARRRGYTVRGTHRRAAAGMHPDDVVVELTDAAAVKRGLEGAEAVIHCAASLAGGELDQARDTVGATQQLLDHLTKSPSARFVLLSSMAVYDYASLATGAELDEESPLEVNPGARGPYVGAKLAQEDMVRSAGVRAAIVRPGLVYGPGRTRFYQLDPLAIGPVSVSLAGAGLAPLCHVDSCSAATIAALDVATTPSVVVNVVDDALPTRAEYLRVAPGKRRSAGLDVPWALLRAAAAVGGAVGVTPGMFHPRRLAARCKPLRYANLRGRTLLQWQPMVTRDALAALARAEDASGG